MQTEHICISASALDVVLVFPHLIMHIDMALVVLFCFNMTVHSGLCSAVLFQQNNACWFMLFYCFNMTMHAGKT